MSKTKAKCVVYKDVSCEEVLKEFDYIENLEIWAAQQPREIDADQVTINGCVLLGWDELYDFVEFKPWL